MSENRGTLARIAGQLAGALQPLEEGFRDSEAFRALLFQLGWEVPGLPPSYVTVADKAVEAGEALRALADDAGIDEALAVITKAGDVYRAVRALDEAPAGIDPAVFLPELGRRLLEFLLGQQLLAEAPEWFATLQALGVIVLEDSPETDQRPGFTRLRFDWEEIPEILTDPTLIPARVYGWGTSELRFDKIAELISQLVNALGLPASLDRLSQEMAVALQAEASASPARTAKRALTVVLFDLPVDGTYVEVGLMLAELPGEGPALPGLILQPAVPGGIASRIDLGDGWAFVLRSGTDLSEQLAVMIRPGEIKARYPFAPSQPLPSGGFGVSLVYDSELPLLVFGQPERTRLEVKGVATSFDLDFREGQLELRLEATPQDMRLVIATANLDGFLGEMLGGQDITATLPLSVRWSNKTGIGFVGGIGFQVSLPANLRLGPITIQQLQLALRTTRTPGQAPDLILEAGASLGGQIGPVTFSVNNVGLRLVSRFTDGNAGPFDIGLSFIPPDGLGLAIDAQVVLGGGYLRFDPQKGEYSGMLELQIAEKISVKGIGLLTTKMPDGGRGYSLAVIIFVEGFTPIQLGLGFALTGIGGLLAINRTFDEETLRAGLKNHTLDSVMFPKDPIRNAPQILSNLNKVFPQANGHHLFGPMVQIAWGTPPLITANLAVVLEFGERLRLLILAQIVAILPKRENDLVRLQMDAIGVLDFDQGTASLDATLHDSRLLKKYVLTGDMAMRLKWESSRNFALAVGGLHPAFNPPPNFPKLERIAINLAAGDNPRLRCEAYFALTSNTVQFGARAELYAKASGFSIQGEAGFDVLIQFDPFHFLADFYAQLQLKRGSTNLFKVRVEGALTGPRPLHIKAKATFEILWWDYSIRIDKTLVEGERPPPPEPIDVLARLKEALASSGNWVSQLPDDQRPVVTLRANPGAATDVLLHPLGTLTVKQSVVPLNFDISRFGQAAPAGARRFTIDRVSLGDQSQTTQTVTDFFAPAQFFEMSDDEKLSRPSFEPMAAGVSIGSDNFVFSDDASDWLEVEAIEFETIIMDKQKKESRRSDPKDLYPLSRRLLIKQALFGAAGSSDIRRTGKAKYRPTMVKHRIAKEGWSIVSTDDLTVQPIPGIEDGKPTIYSEAAQALGKLKQENPAKAAGLKILRLSEVREID